MPPPRPRPARIRMIEPMSRSETPSVVSTAIVMPIMPYMLPWREVTGLDRPRSARMKRIPETRWRTAERAPKAELRGCAEGIGSGDQGADFAGIGTFVPIPYSLVPVPSFLRFFLPVHGEHALRDEEA